MTWSPIFHICDSYFTICFFIKSKLSVFSVCGKVYTISRSLYPLLAAMRLIGMFPTFVRISTRYKIRQIIVIFFCIIITYNGLRDMHDEFLSENNYLQKRSLVVLLTTAIFLLNIYYLLQNLNLLWLFYNKFGLMHASTVSAVVTGAKPLVNLIHLTAFSCRLNAHLNMLRHFDSVDRSFWSLFFDILKFFSN